MPSNVIKNTSKLLTANIAAQIIGLVAYPVLTRLYLPDDFGILNLFMTIGGIATIFATAEYQNAILLPGHDREAAACFHVGFRITLAVCLLFALTIPFSEGISGLLHASGLARHYALLPLYIFALSLWNMLNYWYTRRQRFSAVSLYQVTQCTSGAGLKCAFFRIPGGLVFGTVLAPFVGLAVSLLARFRADIRPLFRPDRVESRRMMREYANFPKYSLPRTIVNYVSGNLPFLLLAPFFTMREIGFYGMALTLSFTPVNLIVRSVHQVFFQTTVERVRQGIPIRGFFRRFFMRGVFTLPLFALLYAVLPPLTAWLLGGKWVSTGIYIRFMLPWVFMTVLVGPVSFLPDIFKKQKIAFLFELLTFVLRAVALAIGIVSGDFIVAVAGYSLASFAAILLQLLWYRRLIAVYERGRHEGRPSTTDAGMPEK